MPRKPQLLTSSFPYHVTARSNNREWFYLPLHQVWEIMLEQLRRIIGDYNARIISFVLMSNHFHMLLETPQANLNLIMNYFMREVSRNIGKSTGRINHVFGGRYRSSLIRDPFHFAHVYKYVYRNPIRAQMVQDVRTYPYSTLQLLINSSFCNLQLIDSQTRFSSAIPPQLSERLDWLSRPLPKECDEVMRRSLRRTEFKFTKRRNDRNAVATLESVSKGSGYL